MNVSATALLAQSAAGGQAQGNPWLSLLPMFLIFGVMIFFMYRSQRKQAKQRQEMLDSVKVGDRVVTAGGIFGNVTKIADGSFHLTIADKVEIEVDKGASQSIAGRSC